jgi:fumarate hydratase class II
VNVKQRLMPAVKALRDAIAAKVNEWKGIVKIGRTHMQDATPITLGEEWSGYAGMLSDDLERVEDALKGVYKLALGGTAVGTGINAAPGFGEAAAAEIANLTGLLFVSAPNNLLCKAPMMRWCSSPARCVRSQYRSTRLPMTFG